MYPALLVDEIIQVIFDSLDRSLTVEELQRTYALLARCCKAWKDLALDRLWITVRGMEPVLTVLRTCEELNMVSVCSQEVSRHCRCYILVKMTSLGSCGDSVKSTGVLLPCQKD